MILILALAARPSRLVWALLVLLWLTVALQSFWLRPVLDARADLVLRGREPPPGPWHGLYAGAEILKLAVLLLIAWQAARRSATSG